MTRPSLALIALLALPLALAPAAGGRLPDLDAASAARIDALFADWDRTSSPGCAMAVYRDGEIVLARGYGMADLERSVAITPRSVFDIASTSKQFVAMCVLLLEEQGRLSLDDDIREHVPEMPDYGTPITIRHLLHHTSGIRDYLTLMSLAGLPFEHDYPEAEIVELLARQKALNFAPGTEHLYSNSGYFLLGEIVHRVTGEPLGDYARRVIFEPLGMRSTRFYDDYKQVVPDRALGYLPAADGGFATEVYLFDLVGDGGVLTSVEDLLQWDRNFYDNRLGKGSSGLIDRMLTRGRLADGETLDYACGLVIGRHRGLPTVMHGGSWAGYRAQLLRFPEQRTSIAVLSNLGAFDPTALARQVADIVLAEELPDESDASEGDRVADAASETSPGEGEPAEGSIDDLQRWTGPYRRRERATIWRVTMSDDGLRVETSQRSYPLVALGGARFRLGEAPVPVLLEFEDVDGHAVLEVDVTGNEQRIYDRVELASPTDADLAEIAGRYRSEELGVVYELSVDDGVLHARVGYRDPMPLEPTVRDEFVLGSRIVTVRRDDRGRIEGLTTSAGRVRNIAFDRVR